ncbi:TPA: glutamate 5-kinase [Candidatus Gastranaerophilales bacterium HUM_9]|nr:MAG TPA: glutamate 5-kinase [Candidatus Gastranaerophilales bacterium HUM_9]HBX35262.1 glutamate 5-kinase [Cyanobacteria bacterium UBA11440]
MDRKEFLNVQRIVIKLGTNVLRNENGDVALSRIYSYIESIAKLVKSGKEVVLVTSGAVGLGKKKLGLTNTDGIALKQACASIGQGKLMSLYEDGFDSYGIIAGQILLTEDDFSQRKKYLSLRTTLNRLLEMHAVPIVNQNDTVTVIELDETLEPVQMCFTDNDKLSALIASELDADLLLILSDVDGLYDSNPKTNPNAKLLKEVKGVTKEIRALGTDASEGGRGGMKTKLEAARLVTRFGGKVLIANGKIPYVIDEIFDYKEYGTAFIPDDEYLSEKKRWIGYATNIVGKLIVNNGAKNAILTKESSLLPIGVISVINDFKRGEVVSIRDENDVEFARGIANYNSDDCKRIIGNHSKEILKLLGFKNYDALITRDYITIL